MEMLVILLVIVGAFICEFVDSSMGMGYGTLLTPTLLLLGLPLESVVPAILFSQGIASLSATFFHVRFGNVKLGSSGYDSRTLVQLVIIGGIAILFAVALALKLPQTAVEIYIAMVVLSMGLIILWKRSFQLSLKKLSAVGFFAIFNKTLTGAGFGPTYTTGQVIAGREVRSSVGMTTAIEAPICIIAFMGYVSLNGISDATLCLLLSIGALLATPFGPYLTREYKGMTSRMVVGILAVFLAIFLLVKNLIWPFLPSVLSNPFFWALISMFALIGASSTLVSPTLGRFPRFNILLVGGFSFGRFVLPLPFVDQPRFDLGGLEWAIGLPLFFLGLIFMAAILQIRPWPAPEEKVSLVTTGFYSISRHPCYLGEVLWGLGLSIMLGSVLGIALTPMWWAGLLFLTILEEEDLERRLGGEYKVYCKKVRGRIIPGLPI